MILSILRRIPHKKKNKEGRLNMVALNFKKPDETSSAAMVCDGCDKKTRVIHITKNHKKLCDTCYRREKNG